MMLRPDVSAAFDRAAALHGVEAAALRAFARVETAGDPRWASGRSKRLFERHQFHRRVAPARREEAVRLGIAWPAVRRENYADQGTEAGVMGLIARALSFDAPAAYASTSYGLGQVMGFNAPLCGYPDGRAMAAAFDASLDAQVEAMVAYMDATGTFAAVAARDWRRAAVLYNGPREADGDYHGRLAKAYDQETGRRGAGRLALAASCPTVATGVAVEGAAGVDALGSVAPGVEQAVSRLPSAPDLPVPTDPLTTLSGLAERADLLRWKAEGLLLAVRPVAAWTWRWLLAHPSVLANVAILAAVGLGVEVYVVRRRVRELRARRAATAALTVTVGVSA